MKTGITALAPLPPNVISVHTTGSRVFLLRASGKKWWQLWRRRYEVAEFRAPKRTQTT